MKILIFCLLWYTIFNAWMSDKIDKDAGDAFSLHNCGIIVNYICAAFMIFIWLTSWFWPPMLDLIRGML